MNPYFTTGVISEKEFIKSKIGGEPVLLKIKVTLLKPLEKPFRPGQFCTFRVAEGIFRAYSIASSYKDFSNYEFIISCGHQGIGANYFKNINLGEQVNFLGPNGHFFIKNPVGQNLIFCATGTGIAPFIPMIEFLMDNSCDTKIALIHGMKDESNFDFYKKIHENLANKCPNFISKFYVSKPSKVNNDFKTGRITDEIKSLDLSNHKDTQFYLCGHPDMVEEISNYLINKGISEHNIIAEVFSSPGYFENK